MRGLGILFWASMLPGVCQSEVLTFRGLSLEKEYCSVTIEKKLGFVEFNHFGHTSAFLFENRVSMDQILSSPRHQTILLSSHNTNVISSSRNDTDTLMLLLNQKDQICFVFYQSFHGEKEKHIQCYMEDPC